MLCQAILCSIPQCAPAQYRDCSHVGHLHKKRKRERWGLEEKKISLDVNESPEDSSIHRSTDTLGKKEKETHVARCKRKLQELAKLIEVISWARKDTMLQTGLTFGIILLYNASLHKALSPSIQPSSKSLSWFTVQSFQLLLTNTSYHNTLYWRLYRSTEMLIPKSIFQNAFYYL